MMHYTFNEIAHFYLGTKGKLISITNGKPLESECVLSETLIKQLRSSTTNGTDITFKPYLRSLNDLTDEECLELGRLSGRIPLLARNDDTIKVYNNSIGNKVISWGNTFYEKLLVYEKYNTLTYNVSQLAFLFLNEFDVYNLIQHNEAIDTNGKEINTKEI